MQINHTSVVFIGFMFAAGMLLRHSTPTLAQTTPGVREELAVFSVCSQAPDAARDVSANVNAASTSAAEVTSHRTAAKPSGGAELL